MRYNVLFTILSFLIFSNPLSAQHAEITNGAFYVPNGRVGIGTSNPFAKFEIRDSILWHFRLNNPGVGGETWYMGASNNTFSAGAKKFLISPTSSSSQSVFIINELNNVGIKELDPQYQLHVNGQGYFTGFLGVNEIPTGQPLAVNGDIEIGGGATGFDGNAEVAILRGRSKKWYWGTRNSSTEANSSMFLGPSPNGDATFNISAAGNVGIGTAIPGSPLSVVSIENTNNFKENISINNLGTGDASLSFAVNLANYRQYVMGIDNSDFDKFKIGTTFNTDGSVSSGTLFTLHPTGGASISTPTLPTGYKLSVDGKIISEGVTVKLSQNWPDYVFEENYNLQSLSEIEKYILKHKHLPNIPSAEEIENEGLSLENIQILMMEKIEELTLHLIAQEKEIVLLKAQLK